MHFKPSGSAVLGCTLICQGKLQCRASEFTGSSVYYLVWGAYQLQGSLQGGMGLLFGGSLGFFP